jgi:hypothetical protein
MKRKILVILLAVIFSAGIALPTLAATPSTNAALSPRQLVLSQLNYEEIDAVNGAVVNFTSTNQAWVDKLHLKYDSMPKHSRIYRLNSAKIEIDLVKTDNGIQAIITVLSSGNANYQNVVDKIHTEFATGRSAIHNFMKMKMFLKTHFNWAI